MSAYVSPLSLYYYMKTRRAIDLGNTSSMTSIKHEFLYNNYIRSTVYDLCIHDKIVL